jgi:hypothetical protein|tara:strand:- start:1602 stop:1832 length:231 start_codon:yes stop_codon:yes gene_type:complete
MKEISEFKLAYCDYIADTIFQKLSSDTIINRGTYIKTVFPVKWDLHETEGYMLSSKKEMIVQDIFGKNYKITVEET